jgi:hypothetical protein
MKPLASLSDDEFTNLVQRAVALPEAPENLVRSAMALFPAQPTTTLKDVAQAALRLVTAALTFDSWVTPGLATGMRSRPSDTRHLLFSTMGRDIDLRISPEASPQADRFALTGQVLGIDETGIVELTAGPDDGGDEGNVRTTALDAFGEFKLDAVLGGTYQITLRLSGDAIQLPPIVVGERPT